MHFELFGHFWSIFVQPKKLFLTICMPMHGQYFITTAVSFVHMISLHFSAKNWKSEVVFGLVCLTRLKGILGVAGCPRESRGS